MAHITLIGTVNMSWALARRDSTVMTTDTGPQHL